MKFAIAVLLGLASAIKVSTETDRRPHRLADEEADHILHHHRLADEEADRLIHHHHRLAEEEADRAYYTALRRYAEEDAERVVHHRRLADEEAHRCIVKIVNNRYVCV